MSFSKCHFCTLQLGPMLTMMHNLWTPLWWPNKRQQQEQTLKGDKRRARHSLAGSSIPSRGHSSHLTPYLKPTHGCQKTCKLPTTTWNKTHTSCNSRWPGWWHLHLSGRPSLLFPLTAPAARGPGTGCCLCLALRLAGPFSFLRS